MVEDDIAAHRAFDLDTATFLEPVSHLAWVCEWPIECPHFIAALEVVGVAYIQFLQNIRLDHQLIATLVERWSPETNTFLLYIGEMTITLQDVVIILWCMIDGPAMAAPRVVSLGCCWKSWIDCCDELLGSHPIEDHVYVNPMNQGEASNFRMGQVKRQTCVLLRWLQWMFVSNSYEEHRDDELWIFVHAYTLFVIGCFYLMNTSGCEVHLQWLPQLEFLADFAQYSLGGDILAHFIEK